MALLSLLLIPATILARRWWTTGIAVATAIALLAVLVPRAIGGPDPGPGPRLHVLSSNMKIGAADPATIVALARLHRTDVLALDEYTPQAQQRLAAAGIDSLFAYSAQTPRPGATGSAIFSRYPLQDTGYRPARRRVRPGVRDRDRARCAAAHRRGRTPRGAGGPVRERDLGRRTRGAAGGHPARDRSAS